MAKSLNQFDLRGKLSLVTGGGRGIGLGIARSLAAIGSDIMVVSRTRSQLEEASVVIRKEGNIRVETLCADVSDLTTHEAIVQKTIEQFGKIDVLVNNAGSNIRKPFLDVTVEDYDTIMQIQLKAVYFLTQKVAKHMVQVGRGKIINLASLTSKIGVANISVYGAAKGGIFALTKSLSLELAPYGITVNAVAPGYVRTAMTEAAFTDPKRQEWMLSRIPLRRFGQPEDIGGAVAYVASSAGDYLNGEVIFIDGGWMSS